MGLLNDEARNLRAAPRTALTVSHLGPGGNRARHRKSPRGKSPRGKSPRGERADGGTPRIMKTQQDIDDTAEQRTQPPGRLNGNGAQPSPRRIGARRIVRLTAS